MVLPELIQKITTELGDGSQADLEGFTSDLQSLDINCLKDHIEYDSNKYCRQILHQTKEFEVILICWLPHQKTPFHGHPNNGCLMKLMKGKLNEVNRKGKDDIETVVVENEVTYLDGSQEHMISNLADHSISLHIYSPSRYYE